MVGFIAVASLSNTPAIYSAILRDRAVVNRDGVLTGGVYAPTPATEEGRTVADDSAVRDCERAAAFHAPADRLRVVRVNHAFGDRERSVEIAFNAAASISMSKGNKQAGDGDVTPKDIENAEFRNATTLAALHGQLLRARPLNREVLVDNQLAARQCDNTIRRQRKIDRIS